MVVFGPITTHAVVNVRFQCLTRHTQYRPPRVVSGYRVGKPVQTGQRRRSDGWHCAPPRVSTKGTSPVRVLLVVLQNCPMLGLLWSWFHKPVFCLCDVFCTNHYDSENEWFPPQFKNTHFCLCDVFCTNHHDSKNERFSHDSKTLMFCPWYCSCLATWRRTWASSNVWSGSSERFEHRTIGQWCCHERRWALPARNLNF